MPGPQATPVTPSPQKRKKPQQQGPKKKQTLKDIRAAPRPIRHANPKRLHYKTKQLPAAHKSDPTSYQRRPPKPNIGKRRPGRQRDFRPVFGPQPQGYQNWAEVHNVFDPPIYHGPQEQPIVVHHVHQKEYQPWTRPPIMAQRRYRDDNAMYKLPRYDRHSIARRHRVNPFYLKRSGKAISKKYSYKKRNRHYKKY